MPWRIVYLTGCLLLISRITYASEVDTWREKAVAALKESQTNPTALSEVARNSAHAAKAYAAAGNEAFAAEMNAYLFWCKKKMSAVALADFTKGGDAVANDALAGIDRVMDVQKAKPCLESAEAFAEAWPSEYFLQAVRFFEVAERFKETLPGLTASGKHTNALATSEDTAGIKKEVAPPAAVPKEVPIPVEALGPSVAEEKQQLAAPAKEKRLAVPPAAALTDAEKRIKARYKDEYAKRKPDEKSALAKKLLENSGKEGDDQAQYASIIAARDVAAEAGDAKTALAAVDRLIEAYVVNGLTERTIALRKLLETARLAAETSRLSIDGIIRAMDDAIAAEEIPAMKALAALGDIAIKKGENGIAVPRMKAKLVLAEEIGREWVVFKPAFEAFKTDRNSPAANVTVGRFYTFMKGDFETGLRCLARGNNEDLKKIAVSDQLNPAEAAAQAALGDAWWALSEKEKGKQVQLAMMTRACFWYSKAHPGLPQDNKGNGEKRIARLADIMQVYAAPPFDMAGRWTVKWAKHPERGQKTIEMLADGTIKGTVAEGGEFIPDRWTFKGAHILVHFKNNAISGMDAVDDNTLKQEAAAGDAVYTRAKK